MPGGPPIGAATTSVEPDSGESWPHLASLGRARQPGLAMRPSSVVKSGECRIRTSFRRIRILTDHRRVEPTTSPFESRGSPLLTPANGPPIAAHVWTGVLSVSFDDVREEQEGESSLAF